MTSNGDDGGGVKTNTIRSVVEDLSFNGGVAKNSVESGGSAPALSG